MREYNCFKRGLIVPETNESPKAEKGRGFVQPLVKGSGRGAPCPLWRGWR